MKRSAGSAARNALDELGAHVSVAGGLDRAAERAAQLGARVLQLFTKPPSRWAERVLDPAAVEAFDTARRRHGIRVIAAHDSYLINLATRDRALLERSRASFRAELERCVRLGIKSVVMHPGSATDGDAKSGLARSADAVAQVLEEVGGRVEVLFETTAGAGRWLGATFEELSELIERIPWPARERVGVCFDTCHVWAAGYNLRSDYTGVIQAFADWVGLDRLRFFHLNDSAAALGSRRDRHAHIARGALGPTPFRRLLNDERFAGVPKVLETPKDDDAMVADRRNLERLRRYRRIDRRR